MLILVTLIPWSKSLPVLNTPNCCCRLTPPISLTPSSDLTIIISSHSREVMETRRDSETVASCYQTRADLVCHVAGIGVMAKIFGWKNTPTMFWVLSFITEVSKRVISAVKDQPRPHWQKGLSGGRIVLGIVCSVCKCAHYAYSIFLAPTGAHGVCLSIDISSHSSSSSKC